MSIYRRVGKAPETHPNAQHVAKIVLVESFAAVAIGSGLIPPQPAFEFAASLSAFMSCMGVTLSEYVAHTHTCRVVEVLSAPQLKVDSSPVEST